MSELKIGSKVPAFSMPATGGQVVSHESLRGKPFVLYFYPKDDTSGCTQEACDFRDSMARFNQLGITVIGVSKDPLKSHDKFQTKHGLTFPLASDEEGRVCENFGVWVEKSMYGRKYMGIERATFLVDATGHIAGIWRNVKVGGHVAEVMKQVEGLAKAA